MQQRAPSCSRRAIPFRLRNLRKRFRFLRSRCAATWRARATRASSRASAAACARSQHGQSEVGFDLRLRLEVERKRAIARAAAALVGEGEAVALDASTTAYYLALELRAKRELVVVTNGLLVATALADAPGITVLVTGGMLRLSAMSLVGDLGTDVLRTTRINKGFLGARGLSLERGLMDLNPDEVRIKQEMADACEQVYGIFDGTKWHRSALLSFVAGSTSSHGDRHRLERAGGRGRRPGARAASRSIAVDPGPREAPPRAAARPAPRRAQQRGQSADAHDGRRRPRRPERPRRRRPLRRRSPDVDEVHRFPNVPVEARRPLHWDVLRLYARRARRACARPAARRRDRLGRRRLLGRRLRAARPRRRGWSQNPVHYRDTRRAERRRARARRASRRASSTSAPASSSCRSTRSSSSPRWRRGRPGARARPTRSC